MTVRVQIAALCEPVIRFDAAIKHKITEELD
jgi:hypothetical protein